MNKISAIVLIGGNYDKNLLKKCLDSVSWCDEIVKVETDKLSGSFADWRNVGAKMAKGEWLFYVDSDEEVTDDLRCEIEFTINKKTASSDAQFTNSAFAIPRKNFIFGKEFKHSGQYPDYQKRLFKKDSLEKWVGVVHEEPVFKGSLGHLKNPIMHYKKMTISQMVDKTNIWSEHEAKLMFDAHHPPMNFFRFCSAGLREFWLRMVIQTAFMDGTFGVIYGLYQVYSKLISYSKLWELQIKNASRNI